MKFIKRIILLVLALTLVLLAAACDFTDKLKGQVQEKWNHTVDQIKGEEPEQKPVDNSIEIAVCCLDTFQPLATAEESVRESMRLVYEPLFELDSQLKTVPVLAESFSVSADGLRATVTLKQGVIWHDGAKFTADDVVYTARAILGGQTGYTSLLKDVSSCRAADASTVVFSLKRPVENFAALLTFPVIRNKTDLKPASDYTPLGTGPYVFQGKLNVEQVKLTAFGMWHGGQAQIESVVINLVRDRTLAQTTFAASETDFATSTIFDMANYTPKGGVQMTDYISNRMTYLGMNFYNESLWGEATRRAIAAVIDKEDIVNTAVYSRGVAVNIPINPSSWLYYDITTRFKPDLENAQKWMAEDGWSLNSSGKFERVSGGKKQTISLEILVNGDQTDKVAVAQKIADSLNAFGIAAKVKQESADVYKAAVAAKQFDLFVGNIALDANMDPTPLVSSKGNDFTYVNKQLDSVITQMGITQNEEELKALFIQYGDIITKEMPFVPLFFTKSSVLNSSKLKRGIQPNLSNPYFKVEEWSVQ